MPRRIWPIVGYLFGSFIFVPYLKQDQDTAALATKASNYFAMELNGSGAFFSSYLSRIGEPSLMTMAQESHTTSYRFESLAAQTGRLLAVRFVLNPNGSAVVYATEESGTQRTVRRTESKIAAGDADRFLHFVETARFWSMSVFEPENRDAPHKVYKMDASTWIFEGVRSGGYHVALRQGPEPGSFTAMIRFLLKDLAKLDDSVVPRTLPAY